MALEDVCSTALYSFQPPKFDGPRFDPLPAFKPLEPLRLDPYADPYTGLRRPSLCKPVVVPLQERFTIVPLSDGTQLHLHNDAGTGAFQDRKSKSLGNPLNAFQAAMAEYYAQQAGLPLIERYCKPKKSWEP